ncbi:MAG: hypothetical protein A2283_15190 [Lentisphaerae bacterium RIFOXYA12_FULL_48_11]|nr:MAG: hypothetical protein A2283_15190 [Lentisphaerae bacterium RIFOXYA12_FULL_48_11]
MLHVNGQVVEYVMSGFGRPAIVLLNGAGGPLVSWARIYPEIESLGTVFAYNRAGIGGSDRAAVPQTGEAIVSTLRCLLSEAKLQAPYILVGHSLGGLYANLFARLYPREVAGVVMLDATHPDDDNLILKSEGLVRRSLRKMLTALDARFGNNKFGEVAFIAETVSQIGKAPSFPEIPLVVVTGGKRPPYWLMSEEAFKIRQAHQKALASLSPFGRQVIAEKSWHFPHISEPAVVISAIREVAGMHLP